MLGLEKDVPAQHCDSIKIKSKLGPGFKSPVAHVTGTGIE